MATDAGFRRNGITQAERKAAQGGAPVFMYHFRWNTPVNDIWYSPHAIEIPFVFRNIENVAPSIGEGPRQNALANKTSAAWIAFARTGDPSNPVTGLWPPYDSQRRMTMVFDDDTRAVADPDSADRSLCTRPMERVRSPFRSDR